MRKVTDYAIHTGKLEKPVRLLVVSDLHDEEYDDILPMMAGMDALLIPGDVTNRYHQSSSLGLAFLREAARRLPTYYAMGNHELRFRQFGPYLKLARKTGVRVLYNEYVRVGELVIGGWYHPRKETMLRRMQRESGYKLLMCHKPEDYYRYVKPYCIDLTLAGHAHGGQIRVFGRGLYAPGQGILPKHTRGVEDGGRLLISAGASNPVWAPRWGNPCEVLRVTLD